MKRWACIVILSLLCTAWIPMISTAGQETLWSDHGQKSAGRPAQETLELPYDSDTGEHEQHPDANDAEDMNEQQDEFDANSPPDLDLDDTEPDPVDMRDEQAVTETDVVDSLPGEDPSHGEPDPVVAAEESGEEDGGDVDEEEEHPEDRIILPEEGFIYTAFDFYEKAQDLVSAYPDLLKMDVLGSSADGRPVFALILAEGIRSHSYEEIYIRRHQLFLEAGNHSRETINPYLLMRTVEDYCMDVRDNSHIPGMDTAAILRQGTFHFLILTNPDGYDAVKHGVAAIRNSTLRQKLVQLLAGRSLSLLKAGIEGTDRNRNFEDEYYHVGTRRWINQFYTKNANSPQEPALEGYPGPYPASAAETRMVQDYIRRYPFRAFISYHSMGRVIYYIKEYLPASFNENVLRPFAVMAAGVTGYRIIHYVSATSAGGYLTHFAVNLTQKPTLTVETTPERTYPTPYGYYEEEYERVKLLPYRAMEYVIQKGYFPYRVYVGGKYFQDYQSEAYAQGVAQKLLGKMVVRSGVPVHEYMLVFTDGKKIPFTAGSGAPFIQSGRSMLPVRRVAETLGADVTWNQSKYQAEIYWDDQRIEIPINKDYIVVNGKTVYMDTVNMLEYNRTYVPLRYVFQSMGYLVSWQMDEGQHIIHIDTPQS